LDQVRGGSTSTKVGQGRGKDQRNDPRAQEEAEDNANHRKHQRNAGNEEIAGRSHHCVDIETRVVSSNGTIARMGSNNPSTSRGIQGTYHTNLGNVHGIG
jgi:hypothetical protein